MHISLSLSSHLLKALQVYIAATDISDPTNPRPKNVCEQMLWD